jgi:hypothetical protein
MSPTHFAQPQLALSQTPFIKSFAAFHQHMLEKAFIRSLVFDRT